MTDPRAEESFFGGTVEPPRPRRREPPILARNPLFAVVALSVSGWLLWGLWPDVSYFFSPRQPIDLGGPGTYRLELARGNRLARIRGELVDAVPVTEARSGRPRTVGRLAGTSLLVDRPGRGGPPVFEGRLLPASARGDYGEVVTVMRARGAVVPEAHAVLRDGERPRGKWLPVAGSAILALLVLVNLRALVKRLTA